MSLLFVAAWMAACEPQPAPPEDAALSEVAADAGQPPVAALSGSWQAVMAATPTAVGATERVVTHKAQLEGWERFSHPGWWDAAFLDVQMIKGGEVAPRSRYPFAVALTYLNKEGTLTQYCGGSLIGPRAVLTAAHCRVAVGHYAVIGRHNLDTLDGRALRVVSVVAHDDFLFDKSSMENDIALVTLAKDFAGLGSPGSFVRLERDPDAAREGTEVTAIGWGALALAGSGSLVLRHVPVPVANQRECAERYRSRYGIAKSMLCASVPGTKDTCHGDSGGPLLLQKATGELVQVGITSFGIGCADPRYHGVYTRVASFLPWIERNMPR